MPRKTIIWERDERGSPYVDLPDHLGPLARGVNGEACVSEAQVEALFEYFAGLIILDMADKGQFLSSCAHPCQFPGLGIPTPLGYVLGIARILSDAAFDELPHVSVDPKCYELAPSIN